jgi:hypothetical protein
MPGDISQPATIPENVTDDRRKECRTMERALRFDGEIVDQQAFLDGTWEYTIEAETTSEDERAPWRLSLSFRWLKGLEHAVAEADCALTDPDGASLYAELDEGSAETAFDEEAGDDATLVQMELSVRSGEGTYADSSGAIHLLGRLIGGRAQFGTVVRLVG